MTEPGFYKLFASSSLRSDQVRWFHAEPRGTRRWRTPELSPSASPRLRENSSTGRDQPIFRVAFS